MGEPDIKPTVIVPDTAPLIHLAAIDALHLLNDLGRVIVVDVVAMEATNVRDKPHAQDIDAWIKAGRLPGSERRPDCKFS